jgi:hypothetical protein
MADSDDSAARNDPQDTRGGETTEMVFRDCTFERCLMIPSEDVVAAVVFRACRFDDA